MPITYKIDVLDALKEKGWTTYKIRQEGKLNQHTLQKIREGQPISWASLEKICAILKCQPGDIFEYKDNI